LFVSGNEWRRHDSEMEPQGGRRNDVQTVGLNAETKKVSAPGRRGNISLDIRFYRRLPGMWIISEWAAIQTQLQHPGEV
jgi:hypothetical protein